MAKKTRQQAPLSFVEIVMRADAETIKAAYEARLQVDELLVQREEAYRKIAEIEGNIEQIVGEEDVFAFPAPPVPVAGFATSPASRKRSKPSPSPAARSTEPDKPLENPPETDSKEKDDSAE